MKKKHIIILSVLGGIILLIAIILFTKNNIIQANSKLTIIDATKICTQIEEKIYEDDKYTYSLPCVKSNSVYVKFENGNKMLVTDALRDELVTIKELMGAGLDVIKRTK